MDTTVENAFPGTSRANLYTPRSLRIRERHRFSLVAAPAEEDETWSTLEELLRQTWTVFGVSTLFGFRRDEIHFKLYAKRLREEVASTLSQEDMTYNAKFTNMENVILRPSPLDPHPIKIEVFAKTVGREEDTEKCIYKGILVSWRSTRGESDTANSVRLPLLLCRGTKSGREAVHNTLSRMFDCMVIALPAKEDDLMWLIPIVITQSSKEKEPKDKDEIHMEYIVPGLSVTDTITVKFRIKDLSKALAVIDVNQNDETGVETLVVEHIEKFRDVLYTQMFEMAGLQLGLCTLHRINMPALTIMENRVKVMTAEAMNRFLLYFNEKALDTLHTLHFDV
ncbi:hypothetical protein KM043_004429 [Ampulex compressa]|nr:hypothetical protein KM043_004429 [Ampulex compressa]